MINFLYNSRGYVAVVLVYHIYSTKLCTFHSNRHQMIVEEAVEEPERIVYCNQRMASQME
jgi:hypothetical protein